MRICRVMADTESFYGVIDGNRVYRLKGIPFDRIDYTGLEYDLDTVKLLAPCQPSKVVAVERIMRRTRMRWARAGQKSLCCF